jgi:hypothetical protein
VKSNKYKMKKNLTIVLLLLVLGVWTAQAQRAMKSNITRNLVVVENKGGTW